MLREKGPGLLTSKTTASAQQIERHHSGKALARLDDKRVYRIMKAHSLLLARHYTERPDLAHDGKVIVMRSNLRSPAGLNRWRVAGLLPRRLRVHLLEW